MNKKDLNQNLDVNPFCKIVYNSPEHEEEWKSKIQKARGLFNKLEYLTVKDKKRKCATLHISPQNYDKTIERIMEDGLVWLPIQRTKTYKGFSHKHFPTNTIDKNTIVYGVLSYDIEYARQFKIASERPVDHKKIGELLGFPTCCGHFFDDAFNTFFDPMYQIAENSDIISEEENTIKAKVHFTSTPLLRYVGFRIISHLPCSLSCEGTKKVSKNIWIPTAKKHYPLAYKYLKQILTLPGEWSVLHGVAKITTEPFTIIANSLPTKEEFKIKWDEVKED